MYVILQISFNNIIYVIVRDAMQAGRQAPPFQRNVTFLKESSLHNLGREIFRDVIHYASPVANSGRKLSMNSKSYKVYEHSSIPVPARPKK